MGLQMSGEISFSPPFHPSSYFMTGPLFSICLFRLAAFLEFDFSLLHWVRLGIVVRHGGYFHGGNIDSREVFGSSLSFTLKGRSQ